MPKTFVCCVLNDKSGEWGLPKGTPEQDEKPLETAKRELSEETGITEFKIIGGKIFLEIYSFKENEINHDKEISYYLAEVSEMKKKDSNIDSRDMKWININESDGFFKFDSVK